MVRSGRGCEDLHANSTGQQTARTLLQDISPCCRVLLSLQNTVPAAGYLSDFVQANWTKVILGAKQISSL